MRARQYAPAWGRFVSPDPLSLQGESDSLYAFVGGRPLSSRDPLGMDPVQVCATQSMCGTGFGTSPINLGPGIVSNIEDQGDGNNGWGARVGVAGWWGVEVPEVSLTRDGIYEYTEPAHWIDATPNQIDFLIWQQTDWAWSHPSGAPSAAPRPERPAYNSIAGTERSRLSSRVREARFPCNRSWMRSGRVRESRIPKA